MTAVPETEDALPTEVTSPLERRTAAPDQPPLRPVRILAELATGFVLLTLIDEFWLGGVRFAGIEPHPYWLIVLLAATLYGTSAGFVAAGVASILWLTGPHRPFTGGEDYFSHIFGITILPLLWTSSALLIGEIVSTRRRRLEAMLRKTRALARQTDTLGRRYRALALLNRDLQIDITTRDSTTAHVLDMAASLADPSPARVADTLVELIAAASGAAGFILYLDRNGLSPFATRLAEDTTPPVLAGSGLQAAVMGEGRVVHIGDDDGRALLEGLGMLALPVRQGRAGATTGVLLFKELPVTAFNEVTLTELTSLSGWVSEIVGHRLPAPVASGSERFLRAVPEATTLRDSAA